MKGSQVYICFFGGKLTIPKSEMDKMGSMRPSKMFKLNTDIGVPNFCLFKEGAKLSFKWSILLRAIVKLVWGGLSQGFVFWKALVTTSRQHSKSGGVIHRRCIEQVLWRKWISDYVLKDWCWTLQIITNSIPFRLKQTDSWCINYDLPNSLFVRCLLWGHFIISQVETKNHKPQSPHTHTHAH